VADDKDPMSSDELLRQAWVDITRDPDVYIEAAREAVELEDLDLPDVDDGTTSPSTSSPVESFVRTRRSVPAPPPVRRPPPPPPPSEPAPPPPPAKTTPRRRGRWILAGITLFAVLRIFNSFDGSDDSSDASDDVTTDGPSVEVVPSSIEPLLDFDGFDSLSNVRLAGSAKLADCSVSLTRKEPGNTAGALWSETPVDVADGFESLFVFEIDHISWFSIGDGFAFVIQNAGNGAVGGVASGNGFKGIPKSLAIEFDTVNHDYEGDPVTAMPDADAPDLLANHVAIHTMGAETNTSHAKSKVAHAALDPVRLYDRRAHIAVIRYVPGTLSVFVDDLQEPVLVAAVDLDGVLEADGGTAYVGFTASTEGLYADHLIHAWKYGSPCLSEGCQDQ
jgi:hypothetical protein